MDALFIGLVAVFLIVGVFFALVGVIGILRFPEFFSRTQASTCISSMGVVGATIAGIFYCIFNHMPAIWYVKLVMIAAMIFLSGSVSGHSLAKGTYKRGHRPVKGFVKNDYEEDGYNDD